MAASIVEFERRVAGRDVKLTGELSVTVPMGVGLDFMPAIVAQFQAANPGVIVELILANEALDLSRRGADVAVRLTNDPPETLVGRRICTARSCVYRRRDTAAEGSAEAIESGAFIGFAESLGPASSRRWIEANVDPGRIVAKANSAHCMLELALQGLGAALLPCYLGDRSPDLSRVGYPAPELDAGLWTLTHADLRRAARVRAFMDFAAAELTKHRRAFEGEDV
jgi:DNA-binding transcriptional LysR family regulator